MSIWFVCAKSDLSKRSPGNELKVDAHLTSWKTYSEYSDAELESLVTLALAHKSVSDDIDKTVDEEEVDYVEEESHSDGEPMCRFWEEDSDITFIKFRCCLLFIDICSLEGGRRKRFANFKYRIISIVTLFFSRFKK